MAFFEYVACWGHLNKLGLVEHLREFRVFFEEETTEFKCSEYGITIRDRNRERR